MKENGLEVKITAKRQDTVKGKYIFLKIMQFLYILFSQNIKPVHIIKKIRFLLIKNVF